MPHQNRPHRASRTFRGNVSEADLESLGLSRFLAQGDADLTPEESQGLRETEDTAFFREGGGLGLFGQLGPAPRGQERAAGADVRNITSREREIIRRVGLRRAEVTGASPSNQQLREGATSTIAQEVAAVDRELGEFRTAGGISGFLERITGGREAPQTVTPQDLSPEPGLNATAQARSTQSRQLGASQPSPRSQELDIALGALRNLGRKEKPFRPPRF